MNVVAELRREGGLEAAEAAEDAAFAPRTPYWRRRNVRFVALSILVVLLIVVAVRWLADRWSHVLLDDARIAANLVTVSSEVSGRVTDLPVVAGDSVRKGALMVAIDPRQAELELAALEAQIASTVAQQDQLRAQQAMIGEEVARKVEAGRAQVAAAEAAQRAAAAVLQNARSHFERVQALARRKVVAEQDLEQAQADLTTAEQQERSAAAGITTARANLAVTETEKSQIAVLDRQIAVLENQKAAEVAERDRKKVELTHFAIAAGVDGVIDSTFADPGEYVSPGTRLLIYHDPRSVWVDANVKETDFRRLKLGAPARITVDAYPGRTFRGEVTRLGAAATSQFALLPSPNPSGNFTKVTQRLPIRIAIEQQEGLLRPGMMVEVSVDVVD